MRKIDFYLDEYSKAHRHPLNTAIHKVCVPLITWSVIALAHAVPLTAHLRLSHFLVISAAGFYFSLRRPLIALLIVFFLALCIVSNEFVPYLNWVSMTVFAVGWVGQFYGHHVEGKRPSFFQDLVFLLIGPLWVLNSILPKSVRLKS